MGFKGWRTASIPWWLSEAQKLVRPVEKYINKCVKVLNKILKVETILFGIWFGFVFPMLGFYKETVTWKIASQSPQSLVTSCIKDKNPFDIICKKSNKCFKDHWSLQITILLLWWKNRTRCSYCFSKETDMWKIAFLGISRDLDFTSTSVQHRFSCHQRNLIFFSRVEICHDRRSCKICASCVNFSR